MLVYKAGLTQEEGARSVTQRCMGCGQASEFVLCSAKTGVGVGIPIVSIFTDKAILARKSYKLVCTVCEFTVNVDRETAGALRIPQGRR